MMRKVIGGVLGVAFVLATFFGVHLSMNMDSQGEMANCPLFGHMEKVCTMTVAEHIAKWQQLFTATVQSNTFVFAAVLITFAFAAFLVQCSLLNQLHLQTFRSRAGPSEYSSSFMLRALGRGILRKRE